MKKLFLLCLTVFSLTSFAVLPTQEDFFPIQCSHLERGGIWDRVCIGEVGEQLFIPPLAIELSADAMGGHRQSVVYVEDRIGKPIALEDGSGKFSYLVETSLLFGPSGSGGKNFRIITNSPDLSIWDELISSLLILPSSSLVEDEGVASDFEFIDNIQ